MIPSKGPSPASPVHRTYTTNMAAMANALNESVAQVGDVITYSGRDWLTYVVGNSTDVRPVTANIYASKHDVAPNLDLRCVLLSDPARTGAGAKHVSDPE